MPENHDSESMNLVVNVLRTHRIFFAMGEQPYVNKQQNSLQLSELNLRSFFSFFLSIRGHFCNNQMSVSSRKGLQIPFKFLGHPKHYKP